MGSVLQELLTEVPLSAVLRERVARAEERYARELENCRQRVAAVERENEALRAKIQTGPASGLKGDRARVLVHLFLPDPKENQDAEAIATTLGMERNVVQYHLEQLKKAGFVDMVSGKYLHGPVYWAITPEGREQVVEGQLNQRSPRS